MTRPPRWLRPLARCPECRAYPPLRIPESERARYVDLQPLEPVGSVQCGRCKQVYVLTAEAYQRAA
jgi:hypothetical protein